jgi:XTP/dITP diphosphohydrolase
MGKPEKMLIATGNAHKVKEFREMLGEDRYAWSDLSNDKKIAAGIPSPEETGATFRANACLKASYYAKTLKTWAMADDSGLEVDAIGGKPGVHSSRWAEMHGEGKGDADNNRLLLEQLKDVSDENRTARFVCVLALSNPNGRIILTARETVEGHVLREARGSNGFGYDPLFFIDHLGKTTAELASEEKHAISHRGKALRVMKKLLKKG